MMLSLNALRVYRTKRVKKPWLTGFLYATASRSVLFRTLAYTGAKQASRVPLLLLLLLRKFCHGWHTSHMRVELYAATK